MVIAVLFGGVRFVACICYCFVCSSEVPSIGQLCLQICGWAAGGDDCWGTRMFAPSLGRCCPAFLSWPFALAWDVVVGIVTFV